MLGYVQARPGDHKTDSRRNVDRVRPVAAGAAGIDDQREVVLDVQAPLAHCGGGADDLGDGFALYRKRGQERAGLRLRPLSVHDRADRRGHRLGIEIATSDQRTQNRRVIAHVRIMSRKLRAIQWPSLVKTDSG